MSCNLRRRSSRTEAAWLLAGGTAMNITTVMSINLD